MRHSKNLKPSWDGESVGHYEDDELVVDTVGLNDRTFVDHYHMPHTTALPVVERFKMIDGGKSLQISIRVEDYYAEGKRRWLRLHEKGGKRHTFRATGITAYLSNGGTLENAQTMAAHKSPRRQGL